MVKPPPISFVRLWLQLIAGVLFLSFASSILSVLTGSRFLNVFPCAVLAAMFYVGLALWWATLWARRAESRVGQYTIGSFFFLTVFLAGFCSLVRWMATAEQGAFHSAEASFGQFLIVAFYSLFLVFLATPFLLRMAESIIWLGVWLLRRKPKDRR